MKRDYKNITNLINKIETLINEIKCCEDFL